MRWIFAIFIVFCATSASAAPCDIVACAEAYSVTRAMLSTYKGPLFQIYNGTTTLDIGQTASGSADMSTWAAFCSNTQTNCVVGKIYAQIHTGSNDLVPSQLPDAPFGPVCSGGTIYKCATNFQIEAATGLPALVTPAAGPAEYIIGATTDTAAVGITAGTSAISMLYNGRNVPTTPVCCGPVGIGHKYNTSDALGTAYYVGLWYGSTGFNPCTTTTSYCAGVDEESISDHADYGVSPQNVIHLSTWSGSGTNIITTQLNGNVLYSHHPPAATLNIPTFTHVGGGADLSQPTPVYMREWAIYNVALSTDQQTLILANEKAFYSCLTFP